MTLGGGDAEPRGACVESPAGRALVVEDDPWIAELWAEVLAAEGWAVERLESALGVTVLARCWRPHVVLLDLRLPYRSGAALLRDLKEDPATAEIPVVIASGASDTLPPDLRPLAAAVLTKPVSLRRLCVALADARESKQERGQASKRASK